ncbi:hypothetical protein [Legionella bononiensis]|uniref:Uncharacterized protein n=1 Tax=Legionella bononiensis TaxID=2793102 RepID=A0ABS1WCM9_9GAMM|nr:hypothetical protein [Legionella bononiensis]MBL7478990.1 hypothetical protein [Legionella bononiensis]MBL7527122.1 hypothetical protein [Legionella bononiensis]MBL7562091.1 hypothetical protein [Legionella bononiensis]
MLEFAVFKQNAMLLTRKLTRSNSQYLGCMGFFSALIPDTGSLDDSITIGMIANNFNTDLDASLLLYVRSFFCHSVVKPEEFIDFKNKVLIGIYIVMLSRYSSTVCSYVNKNFIDLLQHDLGISSLSDLNNDVFNQSLTALSQYCSYVYEHKTDDKIYTDLNNRLGIKIQGEIEEVRNSRVLPDDSWYGAYCGMFCSIWMTNKS